MIGNVVARLSFAAAAALLGLSLQLAWTGWFDSPEGRPVVKVVTDHAHYESDKAEDGSRWVTCFSAQRCTELNGRPRQ